MHLADMRINGVHNMDPTNYSILGSIILKRRKLDFETKLANTRKFDLSKCSDSTIDNHDESLALLAGNAKSIGPLFRGIPAYSSRDFDLQQTSKNSRTSIIHHWSSANPGQLQLEDRKRCLLPSISLTDKTIEDVPLTSHVWGKDRSFYVYGGLAFFRSGDLFANHWRHHYQMIEGSVNYVYLIGPNNDQFENFCQVRAGGDGGIGPGCDYLAKAYVRVLPDACIQVILGRLSILQSFSQTYKAPIFNTETSKFNIQKKETNIRVDSTEARQAKSIVNNATFP